VEHGLDLIKIIEAVFLEGDRPDCSWSTGFNKISCPKSNFPFESFYLKLLKRNKCNHRDFQNLSVNGARSGAMSTKIVDKISRNQTLDSPVIIFYSLFGNDICTPRAECEQFTRPEEFMQNNLRSFNYLDTRVPNGSFVFITGIFNGELMYQYMADKKHPLLPMTYGTVWDFVSSLGSNPCYAWLSRNSTCRENASRRAQELNLVYPRLVQTQNYKNFKLYYLGSNFKTILEDWVRRGNNVTDMFQEIDGGHPGQTAGNLKAKLIYDMIEQRFPEALGKINPFNSEIERIFGDQGGH